MAKKSHRDQLLDVLGTEGWGLSNRALRERLDLAEERYEEVRNELLAERLIEKFQCRGGGIRLSRDGFALVHRDFIEGTSAVAKEKDLYA